jgi:hypothetical protein
MTIHDFIEQGYHCMDCGGNIDVLHHTDTTMKVISPELYSEFRFEDVIPLCRACHARLHSVGNKHNTGRRYPNRKKPVITEDHRRHLSESLKGKVVEAQTRENMSDAQHSYWNTEEGKAKRSEAARLMWQRRRERGTNMESLYKKAWETKRKNGTDHNCGKFKKENQDALG